MLRAFEPTADQPSPECVRSHRPASKVGEEAGGQRSQLLLQFHWQLSAQRRNANTQDTNITLREATNKCCHCICQHTQCPHVVTVHMQWCHLRGACLKWLCLLRITRSRSRRLLKLYLRYLPEVMPDGWPFGTVMCTRMEGKISCHMQTAVLSCLLYKPGLSRTARSVQALTQVVDKTAVHGCCPAAARPNGILCTALKGLVHGAVLLQSEQTYSFTSVRGSQTCPANSSNKVCAVCTEEHCQWNPDSPPCLRPQHDPTPQSGRRVSEGWATTAGVPSQSVWAAGDPDLQFEGSPPSSLAVLTWASTSSTHTQHKQCTLPWHASNKRTAWLAAATDDVHSFWHVLHMLQVEPALQDVGISLIELAKRVVPPSQAEVQQQTEGEDIHCRAY